MQVTLKRGNLLSATFAIFAGLTTASPAIAQETTTYTYDALGRLVTVVHSGGPVSGTNTGYQYDAANNRTSVTVTGSPNGSANSSNSDNGASVPTTVYVILPLNGYTVLAIPR
jgi:YD repeat-containing protein